MQLLIDTTDDKQAGLYLLAGPKQRQIVWSDGKLSRSIIVQLRKLFKGRPMRQLKKIAVVVGPGPFSRIRTGVAVANALGLALQVPVVGVKKGSLPRNKSLVFKRAGTDMVLPYYSKQANITQPSKRT